MFTFSPQMPLIFFVILLSAYVMNLFILNIIPQSFDDNTQTGVFTPCWFAEI